jgi:hypothetical protein
MKSGGGMHIQSLQLVLDLILTLHRPVNKAMTPDVRRPSSHSTPQARSRGLVNALSLMSFDLLPLSKLHSRPRFPPIFTSYVQLHSTHFENSFPFPAALFPFKRVDVTSSVVCLLNPAFHGVWA